VAPQLSPVCEKCEGQEVRCSCGADGGLPHLETSQPTHFTHHPSTGARHLSTCEPMHEALRLWLSAVSGCCQPLWALEHCTGAQSGACVGSSRRAVGALGS
jgi:hypothetical protein